MSATLPQRTSLTLPDDTRQRIESLPEAAVNAHSTSDLLRALIDRGVQVIEDQVIEDAYAEMATDQAPYRNQQRERRNRHLAAREIALHEAELQEERAAQPAARPSTQPRGIRLKKSRGRSARTGAFLRSGRRVKGNR
ncbi:hypothetical protein [Corynebacterium sp. AOP12-C2-36]|uniref:hypothetical protein n=1 Tax=Corynebacterium sp. AOP12-C2-36 TaxID=3457723 RepID=UPI0040341941